MNANQTKTGEGRNAPKTAVVREISSGILYEKRFMTRQDAERLAKALNRRAEYQRWWVTGGRELSKAQEVA